MVRCPHCGQEIDPHTFGWWGLRKRQGKKLSSYMSGLARKRNNAARERMGPEAYNAWMKSIAYRRWHKTLDNID